MLQSPMHRLPGRTPLAMAISSLLAVAAFSSPARAEGPAANSSTTSELAEVVVTATRRSEALLDVPLSVTAFSEAALEKQGIHDIGDLSRITPGLVFTPDVQGRTNIAIRGISSTVGAATTGIYIDDTPIQIRAVGAGVVAVNAYPAIFDLDHVEVLRGPQGTLFGAGSEGGTIRFISPEASLTTRSAYARSEVAVTKGGDASYEIGGALGGPIVAESLGFRVSAYTRRDGGWIERQNYPGDVLTGKNTNSVETQMLRAALTYAPTSNLTLTPSILYQNRHSDDSPGYFPGISDPAHGSLINGYSIAQPITDHFVLPSLRVQWNLGAVSFFSNTSYFDRASPSAQDYSFLVTELLTQGPAYIPGLPNVVATTSFLNAQKIFTQEVRLQTNDASRRLQWVVGAFYQDAKQTEEEFVAAPAMADFVGALTGGAGIVDVFGSDLLPGYVVYQGIDHSHDRQLAMFGQVDFKATDALTLTAGLRVSRSKFEFTNAQDGPFNGGPTGGDGRQSETPVTPKVGVNYKLGPDAMVYASAAKGYRGGGANSPVSATQCDLDLSALGLSAAPLSYNSDSVWNYEVGSKGRFLDRRLELEASAFYVKWNNIQSNVMLTTCGFHFIGNLGSAVSRGVDLQGSFRVAPSLTLSGSVSYTDASYRETVAAAASTLVEDGQKLPGAPLHLTVVADYSAPAFGNGAQAYAHLDYQYANSFEISRPGVFGYDPLVANTGATRFANARVGVLIGGWDVSLFVKNLANSTDVLSRTHETLNPDSILAAVSYQPRTIGLSASYRY